METALEVEPEYLESPLYTAVMLSVCDVVPPLLPPPQPAMPATIPANKSKPT